MPDLILSLALLVSVVVAMVGFDSVPFLAGGREPLSDNGLRSLYGRGDRDAHAIQSTHHN